MLTTVLQSRSEEPEKMQPDWDIQLLAQIMIVM